jgi:hypothetical protein
MSTTILEADFMAAVIEAAHVFGWHTCHVRKSIGKGRKWTTSTSVVGWPDVAMWHETARRLLFAELKSESGKTTAEQLAVLASLAAAGAEVHLWRPSDWDEIARTLDPRRQPPPSPPATRPSRPPTFLGEPWPTEDPDSPSSLRHPPDVAGNPLHPC